MEFRECIDVEYQHLSLHISHNFQLIGVFHLFLPVAPIGKMRIKFKNIFYFKNLALSTQNFNTKNANPITHY